MKRINVDKAPPSVKKFIRSLEVDANGVEVILDGNVVCKFVPPTQLTEMEKAAQHIAALSMSVRQTETYVQGLIDPSRKKKKEPKPEPQVDPNVRDAQEQLQRALGLRVTIDDHNGRGKVVIEYGRLEDFDTLMERLLGEESQ